MKRKKNLERAIILGLILSTGVYGTAWAAEIPDKWDPKVVNEIIDGVSYEKLVISPDNTVTNTANYIYQGKKISDFDIVEIFFDASKEGQRPIGVYSERFDWDNTNLVVHVTGNYSNNDALHFSNFDPYIHLNSLTIDMQADESDAINLSRDIRGNTDVHLATDVTAIVKDGNGIRANASKWDDGKVYSAKITIEGKTNVTINADANNLFAAALGDLSPVNPTAIWAGSDADIRSQQKAFGKGEIYLIGKTTIQLNGAGTDGLSGFGGHVYGISAGKNGHIEVNDLEITAEKEYSYGVSASEVNITFNVNDHTENKQGTKVILNGDTNIINMKGENSKALYAEGVDANNNSNSVKSGDNGIGNIAFVGDIVAENGGAIELDVNGDYQNFLQGDIIAFGAEANKNANINLITKSALAYEGDALAANGGEVNVVLGNYSNWSGRADDYQDAADAGWLAAHTDSLETKFDGKVNGSGIVNVTMGERSFWNVTGQSWITKLTSNNSYIILNGEETGGHALHIGEVDGSNTFVMNVRPTETGDMLYVKNGTNATQNLVINNAQEVLDNMDVGDAVRFATVANAGGGFNDGEFVDMPDTGAIQTFGNSTRIADAGMFNVDFDIVYKNYNEKMDGDLADKDGTSSLEEINDVYNGGEFSEEKPGSDYVDEVYGGKTEGTATNSLVKADVEDITGAANAYIVRTGVTKENLSDAGQTIVNMSRANYKNAIYMDRLNKRLGEARYINGEDDQGMWVRLRHDRIGHSGEFRSMNTMYESGEFRSMNTMYELGYDVKQDCDNGERRLGFAVDYMRGSTSYSDIVGKGETKRYGLWLYDTWLGDKGHYADYVLKWGHLSNDFDIFAKTSGENITGDYSNNVFSASAEYGRKKDIGNDWYFEPQAQLQLARVTGADYVSSQDTKVSVDGINSLIGRAGFRLGKDLGERSTVYVKADLLHEFLGDQTITASDATGTFRETYENKGTWYDVGFGFATAMGKNSYAFMDFEKSFGNDNDETYQINAGVQWTF